MCNGELFNFGQRVHKSVAISLNSFHMKLSVSLASCLFVSYWLCAHTGRGNYCYVFLCGKTLSYLEVQLQIKYKQMGVISVSLLERSWGPTVKEQ